MRRLPLALALVLVVVSLVGTARPAGACTCAPFDTRAALAASDAAFVGSVISRTEPPLITPDADGEAIYRFRVEQAVKGDLGEEVEVRSPADEASCGLSAPPGRSVGLLLTQRDGDYHGDLCRQPSAERLMRAAEPLPPPDGQFPAQLLIGSTYGNGRSVALGPDGRLAGIGLGRGTTQKVAVCPEAHKAVELFGAPEDDPGAQGITVRRLATMETEAEVLLPGLDRVIAVSCRDAEATDVVLVTRMEEEPGAGTGDTTQDPGAGQDEEPGAGEDPEPGAGQDEEPGAGEDEQPGAEDTDSAGRSRIVRLAPGAEPAVLWEGVAARHAAFRPAGGVAYLNIGPQGEEVVAVPLDDPGLARTVTQVPAGSGPMVASPDGRRLATVAVGSSRPSRVVTVDLATDPPVVAGDDLSGAGVAGEVHWTASHLVFTPRLRPAESVRIYDPSLELLASWAGWIADHSLVMGERLFGVSQGAVRSATLTTGPAGLVRELEDALMVSIAGATPLPAEPEPPPSTTTSTTAPPPPPTTTTSGPPPTTTTSSSTTTTTRPEPTTTTRPPPTTVTEPELAEPAASRRDGSGVAPILAAGAALALAVAGGAAIIRWRQRRPGRPPG